jgi:hypothetical protein
MKLGGDAATSRSSSVAGASDLPPRMWAQPPNESAARQAYDAKKSRF